MSILQAITFWASTNSKKIFVSNYKRINNTRVFLWPFRNGVNEFVFAMFIYPEIHSFAAYNIFINYLDFQFLDFGARLLSGETVDDYYPEDKR